MTGTPQPSVGAIPPAADGPDRATPGRPALPGLTPPAEHPVDRRAAVRRGIFIGGFFILLFGVVLPRFVNYGEVLQALRSLSPIEVAVLLAIGGLAWLLEGASYAIPLPGLPISRAVETYLGATAISNTIPGPVDMGVRYGLFRGWGFSVESATSGISSRGSSTSSASSSSRCSPSS